MILQRIAKGEDLLTWKVDSLYSRYLFFSSSFSFGTVCVRYFLQKQKMVGFKCNNLVRIHPDALQPQLRWLILTDNAIESIPKTIGRCKTLQKLMLSGNKLKEVPSEISNCTNLELVRLASNQIQKVSFLYSGIHMKLF